MSQYAELVKKLRASPYMKALTAEAADALSLIEAERDKLIVPEGYVLVPREPTEAMRRAGMDVLMYRGDIYARDDGTIVIETTTPGDLWRNMLAALHPTDKDHGDGN